MIRIAWVFYVTPGTSLSGREIPTAHIITRGTSRSTFHTFGQSPSCIASLLSVSISSRLPRFSTNISACSPTLYDTSKFNAPKAQNGTFCISYHNSLFWKTWQSWPRPVNSLQTLHSSFQQSGGHHRIEVHSFWRRDIRGTSPMALRHSLGSTSIHWNCSGVNAHEPSLPHVATLQRQYRTRYDCATTPVSQAHLFMQTS